MYKWQYNGVAPWTDIINWCWDTYPVESVYYKFETIYFHSEKDYLLFLLRWA